MKVLVGEMLCVYVSGVVYCADKERKKSRRCRRRMTRTGKKGKTGERGEYE